LGCERTAGISFLDRLQAEFSTMFAFYTTHLYLRDFPDPPELHSSLQAAMRLARRARRLAGGCFVAVGSSGSGQTIEQGFTDAQVLTSLVPIAQAAQIVYGEDAGGLASLEALIDGGTDALGITLLVRQAILLRHLVADETWEPLKQSLEEQKPKAIALIEMHRALPEYSDVLSGDSKTKLAALPTAEREQIHARVRAFFTERPDLAATLNDS
jgi:hypothetical protein